MSKKVQFFDVPNETGAVMGQVKFDPFRSKDLFNQWSAYFGGPKCSAYLGDFKSYSDAVKALETYELAKHLNTQGLL